MTVRTSVEYTSKHAMSNCCTCAAACSSARICFGVDTVMKMAVSICILSELLGMILRLIV